MGGGKMKHEMNFLLLTMALGSEDGMTNEEEKDS